MLDVSPIAAFQDNYIWLIRGTRDPRQVAVVDPGDAGPVQAALAADGLQLCAILATHHHADHVGGVAALVAATGAAVFGPARERMPVEVTPLAGGDRARLPEPGLEFRVMDVPFAGYAAALFFEHLDHQVKTLAGLTGGHPLKHLAAAAGTACAVLMLKRRAGRG